MLLLLRRLLCCRFDAAGVSIIDFPDGARNGGVMRCLNYTAHLGRSGPNISSRLLLLLLLLLL
jgi:hypothetical protein